MAYRLLLAAVCMTLAHALPGQARYTIVDLGSVPAGSGDTTAVDMNATGDCVGWSIAGSAPHAFLYTDAGGIQDLGFLPGQRSAVARGVNTLLEVVGDSSSTGWQWTSTGGSTSFAPGQLTEPYAINNAGTIVGTVNAGTFSPHPFLYTPTRGLVLFAGAVWGNAFDVNEHGTVLGNWGGPGGSVYDAATGSRSLPTLPGFPSNAPSRINELGQVAGNAIPSAGPSTWFLYSPGSGIVDVGRPGPFGGALAGLNNFGDMVGTHDSPVDNAFLYTSAGGFQNLNTLIPAGSGYLLRRGVAINDAGQILCQAYHSGMGAYRAVRLDPTAIRAWTERVGAPCGASSPDLSGSRPVLGAALSLALTSGAPSSAGMLVIGFGRPARTTVSAACTIQVDLGAAVGLALATDSAGSWSTSIPVPASPALAGVPLTMQTAVAATGAPVGFDLSNGLLMQIGN